MVVAPLAAAELSCKMHSASAGSGSLSCCSLYIAWGLYFHTVHYTHRQPARQSLAQKCISASDGSQSCTSWCLAGVRPARVRQVHAWLPAMHDVFRFSWSFPSCRESICRAVCTSSVEISRDGICCCCTVAPQDLHQPYETSCQLQT